MSEFFSVVVCVFKSFPMQWNYFRLWCFVSRSGLFRCRYNKYNYCALRSSPLSAFRLLRRSCTVLFHVSCSIFARRNSISEQNWATVIVLCRPWHIFADSRKYSILSRAQHTHVKKKKKKKKKIYYHGRKIFMHDESLFFSCTAVGLSRTISLCFYNSWNMAFMLISTKHMLSYIGTASSHVA